MTQFQNHISPAPRALVALSLLAAALASPAAQAQAQNFPVTPKQRSTAQQIHLAGVPLSELAPNAPDEYTVKRGDTLWHIARLFLKSPWRWPELWGINLDNINNPHLIYPGQTLVLDRSNGRAVLRGDGGNTSRGEPGVVKLSPRARAQPLAATAVPTLSPEVLEPFLAEPIVMDEDMLKDAPRIAATQEHRVLLGRGDRAYARSGSDRPLTLADGQPTRYRVFREAKPLKDPGTGEILGYEGQFIGQIELVRGEETKEVDGDTLPVPATFDVLSAKEEMRLADRMVAEPEPKPMNFVPHAPTDSVNASVVSIYGNTVRYAAQNQIIVINRGTRDGMQPGHVLTLLKAGARVVDKTDSSKPTLQLPDERNGLGMVFRSFEKVSYVLVLEITDAVKVGDRLVNPD